MKSEACRQSFLTTMFYPLKQKVVNSKINERYFYFNFPWEINVNHGLFICIILLNGKLMELSTSYD